MTITGLCPECSSRLVSFGLNEFGKRAINTSSSLRSISFYNDRADRAFVSGVCECDTPVLFNVESFFRGIEGEEDFEKDDFETPLGLRCPDESM